MARDSQSPDSRAVSELARVFLKLGTTAFGGPAAHIALMREEVVRQRGWLSEQEFLDLIGATNLIPGPNSTEMAIHVGHKRAGWRGLLVAGSSFILPSALMVGGIAWSYVRFGALPQAMALLNGVKPVVVAIVALALWSLARTAVKSGWLGVLAAASLLAVAIGADELLVLGAAGALAALVRHFGNRDPGKRKAGLATLLAGVPHILGFPTAALASGASAATTVTLGTVLLVFLKAGTFLFGSGYVLFAFLRADLVGRLGWLTERQLLDAIAVGQVTPGPVFTTATFIGYVLGGVPGAIVATVGVFLPAFVFVAASAPLLPRLRRSPTAAAVLDGVNVSSLALMAVVTWHLGRAALVDVPTVSLALVSAALLATTRINAVWLILGGAAFGLWLAT